MFIYVRRFTLQQAPLYIRDAEGVEVRRHIDECMEPPKRGDALANIKLPKSPYRASWVNQFAAMARRSALELIRDPVLISLKIFQALVSVKTSVWRVCREFM